MANKLLIILALIAGVLNVSTQSAEAKLRKTKSYLFRQNTTILKCLGQEETMIHRGSSTGALYEINRHFIDHLTQDDNLKIKKEFLQKICNNQAFSPSVSLLMYLLIYKKELFVQSNIQYTGLLNDLPELFLTYLTHLKKHLPTHDCLEKNIPEIPFFMKNIQHLEMNITRAKLFGHPKKVRAIFDKLRNFNDIIKVCQEDLENRTKKKKGKKKRPLPKP